MKRIVADSIKAFFLMLAAVSAAYADTNLFDISTKYIIGDIVSAEGTLQVEVLANTEDKIEIGLFNQEDQVIAMLMWDVRAESGNVILNLDTENEKTLPIQITEQMNPENRMETLANGLLLMAVAPLTEPLLPEKLELRLGITENSRTTKAASLPVIVTSGVLDPQHAQFGRFEESLRDNTTRFLTGKLVSYTRVSGGSDKRPVWVRFMAYNYPLKKWNVMGWLLVKPFSYGYSRFRFTIPEPYDLDRTGNDLRIAKFSREYDHPLDWRDPVTYPAYVMRYAADAWSGPGKQQRTVFITTELGVLDKF